MCVGVGSGGSLVAFTLVAAVPYLFLIFVQAVARTINIKEWEELQFARHKRCLLSEN